GEFRRTRREAMSWIEANGASLRYELSGSGRETVVLIHEVGGCIESWDDALPAFQGQFRVLRYDQRGFGMSEKTRVITMDGIVADLVALLDALRIPGPVHLAGCAMGAAIALAFAGRHQARVGRTAVASPATWSHAVDGRAGRGPDPRREVRRGELGPLHGGRDAGSVRRSRAALPARRGGGGDEGSVVARARSSHERSDRGLLGIWCRHAGRRPG